MTTNFKSMLTLLVLFLAFSCSNTNKNTPGTDTNAPVNQKKTAESIVVNGIVKAISFGKDGYTAEVQTEKDGIYAALVSIVNLGGPENYKPCNMGDKVSLKGEPSVLAGVKQLNVKEIISITPTQIQLLISPISFRGIQIGDLIANHKEYIQKTKLKTGEGTFDVYEIKDFDNNPAGYLSPDPKDNLLVGDITVNSPKAQTAQGIKIGSTFGDLQKTIPGIMAHGSEIESRTTATANNLTYRLDAANSTYEIDQKKIPATTKITEITINRGATVKAMILEAEYRKLQAEENCWQTNKTLILRSEPGKTGKVEGKHFAGEMLRVLGTKMIDNQLWVNVKYLLTVKIGYEDQFADGRVTPSGSPSGWIGGLETPKINCK